MIIEKTFYSVRCDCCGEIAGWRYWPDTEDEVKTRATESGFRMLGGKHYCPECYTHDEFGRIVTKDGRKFTIEGKEIEE